MEKESKLINEDTARGEAMGFVHGESKEKVNNVLDKVWEMMRAEGLSITQAKILSQKLAAKVRKEEMLNNANTTIK